MKKYFLILVLFAVLMIGQSYAETGIGIIIGEPTGLSFKHYMGASSAIDAGFAWSFSDNAKFHLHGDYLLHNSNALSLGSGKTNLYYGIGGRILLRDDEKDDEGNNKSRDDKIGIRVPLGVSYDFASAPFDIFLEIVPILDLVPDSEFDINAGFGFRYYF